MKSGILICRYSGKYLLKPSRDETPTIGIHSLECMGGTVRDCPIIPRAKNTKALVAMKNGQAFGYVSSCNLGMKYVGEIWL